MTKRRQQYLNRRNNAYVPACGYSADMTSYGPYDVVFGPVAVASAANILSATSIATAVDTTTFLQDNTDPVVASVQSEFAYGPGFGRCLQVVASGAATSNVTIHGRDYLGQPMTESFTLNGTTPVIGNKAFKWIDRITAGVTAATTINVGTTNKLGLPYRMQNVLAEHADGVRVGTLGTLQAASSVDPATATTTDPRGCYTPNTTPNGTIVLSAIFIPNERLNANGNGGLHGLKHFSA